MPPEIRLAKRIKYLIGNRAVLGCGEENYSLRKDRFGNVEIDGLNPDILNHIEGVDMMQSSAST